MVCGRKSQNRSDRVYDEVMSVKREANHLYESVPTDRGELSQIRALYSKAANMAESARYQSCSATSRTDKDFALVAGYSYAAVAEISEKVGEYAAALTAYNLAAENLDAGGVSEDFAVRIRELEGNLLN